MKRGVGHAVLPFQHFQFHAGIREHFQLSVAVGSGDAGLEVHLIFLSARRTRPIIIDLQHADGHGGAKDVGIPMKMDSRRPVPVGQLGPAHDILEVLVP